MSEMRILAGARPRLLAGVVMAGIAVAGAPGAEDVSWWTDVAEQSREAVVFIRVRYVDPNNEESVCEEVTASGFVVTWTGYVVSAAHFLTPPKNCEGFEARLDAKLGWRFEDDSYIPLDPIRVEMEDDVSIWFLGERRDNYAHLPICNLTTVRMGTQFVALGFPFGGEFNGQNSIYQSRSGRGGAWVMSSDFTHGFSGGPVLDAEGRVVGIVKGGARDAPAVRWVIPLRHAANVIGYSGLDNVVDCESEEVSAETAAGTVVPEDQQATVADPGTKAHYATLRSGQARRRRNQEFVGREAQSQASFAYLVPSGFPLAGVTNKTSAPCSQASTAISAASASTGVRGRARRSRCRRCDSRGSSWVRSRDAKRSRRLARESPGSCALAASFATSSSGRTSSTSHGSEQT